jgi:hypothetical protein
MEFGECSKKSKKNLHAYIKAALTICIMKPVQFQCMYIYKYIYIVYKVQIQNEYAIYQGTQESRELFCNVREFAAKKQQMSWS